MSATIINLIIQLIAGAIGGNAAGAISKDVSLGTGGNTIAGALGGIAGGSLLTSLIPMLSGAAGGVDIGALVGQLVGGGVPEPVEYVMNDSSTLLVGRVNGFEARGHGQLYELRRRVFFPGCAIHESGDGNLVIGDQDHGCPLMLLYGPLHRIRVDSNLS